MSNNYFYLIAFKEGAEVVEIEHGPLWEDDDALRKVTVMRVESTQPLDKVIEIRRVDPERAILEVSEADLIEMEEKV